MSAAKPPKDSEPQPPELPGGIDPRLLLTFREVARLGSISAAARKLGWTQPALGQQLRRLEREAGTPLVTRHPRGISLTPAGEVLLGHADAIAGRLLVAQAAMRDAIRRRATRLIIATFPSGSSAVVAPAAARLTAADAQLDLRIVEMEPPHAIEALTEGQVDAALVFEHQEDVEDLSGDGHLRWLELGRDELLVAMPADHPLAAAGEERLPASHLTGQTWISGCLWCQANLTEFGEKHGFHAEIHYTSEDQLVVQELVASGLGISLIPQMSWRTYQRPGVAVRHLKEMPYRTISMVVHRHDPRRLLGQLAAEMKLAGHTAGLQSSTGIAES